jgi:hypothetical protein
MRASAVRSRKRTNRARRRGGSLLALILLLAALAIQFQADSALAAPPDAKATAKAAAGEVVITGSVVDRESKRPIASFRVMPGIHLYANREQWQRSESVAGADGHFRVGGWTARQFPVALRIEADGYQPAVWRDAKVTEGGATVNFELTKGEDLDAVVLTPAGQPAGKAKVGLWIPGSELFVENGDIVQHSNADYRETDARGQFHFPPQFPGCKLVITHPSGFAAFEPDVHARHRTIHLDAWTRVEGTLRVGGQSQANVLIQIWLKRSDVPRPDDDARSQFFYIGRNLRATTGPDGHFVFERVATGTGQVGPALAIGPEGAAEAISSRPVWTKFPLGQTVHIELGGNGRRVVGKFRLPPGTDKPVPLNLVSIHVAPKGATARAPNLDFYATAGRDGTFHIDDMPAGEFELTAQIVLLVKSHAHLNRHFVGGADIAREVAGAIITAAAMPFLTAITNLLAAPPFEATVLTPDGKPAVAAKVAVVLNSSFISLNNGDADRSMGAWHRCESDRSGRFQFRPPEAPELRFGLVITHPTGYAFFLPVPHAKQRWITLDPWTRIEGTLQAGGKPVPDTIVSIDRYERVFASAIEQPALSVSEIAKTDAKGGFVFERVLSGSGRVSCHLPQRLGLKDANFRSTCTIQTVFPVGGTVPLEFGRRCRTVIGRLQAPPDLKMRPQWLLATIELRSENPIPDRQTREFKGSPEQDGSFRIDNIPPGRWTLSIDYINYSRENQWRLYLLHHFSVAEPGEDLLREPLDLRVLTLEAK